MSDKKSLPIKTIVFGALGAVAVSFLVIAVINLLFNQEPAIEQQLSLLAKQLNKKCPMIVDEETRLDTTQGGPGKKFTYYYTLVSFTSDDKQKEMMKAFLTMQILTNAQTNKDMAALRSARVALLYVYRDKNGVDLFQIEVKPEDYK